MNHAITGRQPVLEALRAGTKIARILVLRGAHGQTAEEIRRLARSRGVEVREVTREEFLSHSTQRSAQGVLALVAPKRFTNPETIMHAATERREKGMILILDEIKDPQNLGALVRTAECAGFHGVVLPKHHRASVTGAAIKASAGATEHVPIAEVTNIVTTLEHLKREGYWVIGLDAGGEKLYADADYTAAVAIVVGSEGRGLRRLVREHCDTTVRIPLYGKISSLNASVAGALVMYEVARQRHPPQPAT